MLPKIVLHKKNGHRHVPGPEPPSLGELMRDVHSGGVAEPRPTFDLLKFATVVRSEKRRALLLQAAHHVDSQHSALSGLLARTETALARGELPDIRATLETLQTQAGEASRLFARLLASAETRSADHGVVAVNDLVASVAEHVSAAVGVPVVTQTPRDASIIGNTARLERALAAFLIALAGGPSLGIETAHVQGVIQGETIVRITVTGGSPLPSVAAALGEPGPLAEPAARPLDIHLARQIVAEHGGIVSLERDGEGRGVIRIELPEL